MNNAIFPLLQRGTEGDLDKCPASGLRKSPQPLLKKGEFTDAVEV